MTVASGDLSPRSGSSDEPSSPTGHQTASAPSKKRPARTGRRLFAVDRALGRGEAPGAATAAAPVLAKVPRGGYMRRAANRHPGWDFDTNVGYSTPEHRAAIATNGVSPLHRMSFASIAYQQLPLGG